MWGVISDGVFNGVNSFNSNLRCIWENLGFLKIRGRNIVCEEISWKYYVCLELVES